MKDSHKDNHTKVLEKIAAIEEAQGGKPRKPTFTLAEAEAAQVKAERSRRRKLKGKHRPGLKSNGLSWLTSFQRAVILAFTDVKKYGLPRTFFRKRIKLPREGI